MHVRVGLVLLSTVGPPVRNSNTLGLGEEKDVFKCIKSRKTETVVTRDTCGDAL